MNCKTCKGGGGIVQSSLMTTQSCYVAFNKTWSWNKYNQEHEIIWVPCHLKSPTIQMFLQQLVEGKNRENIKASSYFPIMGGIQSVFQLQRAINREHVFNMSDHTLN